MSPIGGKFNLPIIRSINRLHVSARGAETYLNVIQGNDQVDIVVSCCCNNFV